jgi:hypothetical protein
MKIGIISFKVESRIFKFKTPLWLKGEYVDGGVCLTHSNEPYLTACDKTFTKCEKIIREQLALTWDDYVLAPDNELTLDGIVLKNKLSAMAEEAK